MRALKWFSYLTYPLLIVIIALFLMAGFKGFYKYEFAKNDIYEVVAIDKEDMPLVIDRLSGYVVGRYPIFNYQLTIDGEKRDVYGEREVLHMQDVRKIFDFTRYAAAAIALLIVVVFSMVDGAKRRDYLLCLTRAGLIGVAIIVAFLGLLVTLDFSKYFVVFHEIFFDNDLWLLNPATDVLIQMLPEVFFRDIAVAIVALALVLAVTPHIAVLMASRGKRKVVKK